jgi:hypothetical protein
VCKFENDERGRISFKGNILFTHFGEIGVPMQTISIPHEIDMATINAMAKVSVNNDDKVDVKDEP